MFDTEITFKLEIKHQCFCHCMSVFHMTISMIEVFLSFYIKPFPKTIYHIIVSEFIMMPC